MALRVRNRPMREIGPNRARAWRTWGPAWLGMLALAFANGTVRVAGYQPLVGEPAARQIATGALIALLGGYAWLLHRRVPLPDAPTAYGVGGLWAVLTLGFEFGFGHYVVGTAWSELLADYDLSRGRTWMLVPIATLLTPAAVHAVQARRAGAR